jgi:hypothetical protein
MGFVVQMLADTPPYVFALLAYLVWQGVLSLRTRRLAIWRMLIVPGLFEAAGLLLLVLRPSSDIVPLAAWLVALVAFIPLGLVTGPRLLAVDRTSVHGREALCRWGAIYSFSARSIGSPLPSSATRGRTRASPWLNTRSRASPWAISSAGRLRSDIVTGHSETLHVHRQKRAAPLPWYKSLDCSGAWQRNPPSREHGHGHDRAQHQDAPAHAI